MPLQFQEYNNFKKFGESLLSKSGKLTDLISTLESAVDGKSDSSPDFKRAQKPRPYKYFFCRSYIPGKRYVSYSIMIYYSINLPRPAGAVQVD